MKKLIAKLEDIMVAVTFAEAGEYDEAKKISGTAESERPAHDAPLGGTVMENAGK
jgi:hypothetical protein